MRGTLATLDHYGACADDSQTVIIHRRMWHNGHFSIRSGSHRRFPESYYTLVHAALRALSVIVTVARMLPQGYYTPVPTALGPLLATMATALTTSEGCYTQAHEIF